MTTATVTTTLAGTGFHRGRCGGVKFGALPLGLVLVVGLSAGPAKALEKAVKEHGVREGNFLFGEVAWRLSDKLGFDIGNIRREIALTGRDTLTAVAADVATLLLALEVDPVIEADMTVTNPLSEEIDVFLNVFLPTEPFNDADWTVWASLDVTVTDTGGDGAAVTPTTVFISDTDPMGMPTNVILTGGKHTLIGDVQVFGGNIFEPGLGNAVLGPGEHHLELGPMPIPGDPMGPPQSYNSMEMIMGFSLSPNDEVSILANITVLVPEPSAALVVLAGTGLLAAGRRRG